MLNVGVPEIDGPEEPGLSPEQYPDEQDAETSANEGLETGENADLDRDPGLVGTDPSENPDSTPAPASLAGPQATTAPEQASVDQPHHEPLETFAALLSEFERNRALRSEDGSKQIDGSVVAVTAESVFVDIGFKTEGVLPLAAFASFPATLKEPPKPGDRLRVTVKGRNEEGYYDLSLLKVAQPKDWSSLEAAFNDKAIVAGTVTGTVKGGLTVDVGMRAFLPASRSGARDAAEMEKLVGQEIRCRITKLDVADEDVVVDRRAVIEEEERSTKERRYQEVSESDTVSGVVRSLTDYGAFVDIGGVDALLHISDMAWSRVASPSDVLSAGEHIQVKVLRVEPDKRRISVGLKQLQPHPWDAVAGKFTTGERVTGVVARLTDFGAFVEIAPGVEGLVHISEMSWAKKVRKPGDMVKPGETVEVVILSINPQERRISLGLKQALGDPWVTAADKLLVGAVVEGPVVSFTKFGAFVQVAEGVEGMIHISEIVPDKRINHPQDELRTGQIVKAQVIEVDRDKRQLKLSIKQLIPTSLEEYLGEHQTGDVVSGRVTEATSDRLLVELGEGIRVTCKPPVAAAIPANTEPAPAPDGQPKPNLSALSSMLKAKWKSGGPDPDAPLSRKNIGVRAGEVRSFRIITLDVAARTIAIEAI